MAVIGEDCDLILIHEDVHGGDPYGFVLTPDPTHQSSGVSIQREYSEDDEILIYIFFTVLLADDLKNPDGSEHIDNRKTMYEMLLEYLGQTEGITVGTVMGTWLGTGPLGHSATELHLVEGSYISVKLGNVSEYRPPVDSDIFFNSLWVEDDAEVDYTWDSSLWR